MDDDIAAIMSGDQAHILLLPNAVGAAQDVIDDIGIFGIEAWYWLTPLALWRKNLGNIPSADIGDGIWGDAALYAR